MKERRCSSVMGKVRLREWIPVKALRRVLFPPAGA